MSLTFHSLATCRSVVDAPPGQEWGDSDNTSSLVKVLICLQHAAQESTCRGEVLNPSCEKEIFTASSNNELLAVNKDRETGIVLPLSTLKKSHIVIHLFLYLCCFYCVTLGFPGRATFDAVVSEQMDVKHGGIREAALCALRDGNCSWLNHLFLRSQTLKPPETDCFLS